MRVPWVENAGRLAVTMTAATFSLRKPLTADVRAEAVQHRGEQLAGERRIVDRVAGPFEADDEPVADQLILTHTPRC